MNSKRMNRTSTNKLWKTIWIWIYNIKRNAELAKNLSLDFPMYINIFSWLWGVSDSLSAVCSTRQNKFYTKETNPNNFSNRSNITSNQIWKAYFNKMGLRERSFRGLSEGILDGVILLSFNFIILLLFRVVTYRIDKLFSCHMQQRSCNIPSQFFHMLLWSDANI